MEILELKRDLFAAWRELATNQAARRARSSTSEGVGCWGIARCLVVLGEKEIHIERGQVSGGAGGKGCGSGCFSGCRETEA